MFNLGLKGKLGSDRIGGNVTTLSVSALNNQFKAVAVHRGSVIGRWERPGEADIAAEFETFIGQAVHETGYRGQTVSLVLAHPRLVQQMVDVPPVKGTALNKVVQRQAQQQKFFPGEAAYASQMLLSTKSSQRVLLHLLPRVVLNQCMLACRRNNLHLVSVLPASATLQRQIHALGLQKADAVMLAAETGGSTTVVVCDGEGRLLVARTLQGSWNQDAAKLALDLNRTVLYASQQFNVALNRGIWLFGSGAEAQVEALQRHIQVPVRISPVASGPFYWAIESLKIRPEGAPNFQSPELQKAPQRRVFARVVGAAATILLAGSIALTSYSILQARKERTTMASFEQQIGKMEARQKQLQELDSELQRKQQAIDLVLGTKPPPKPAWLLAYMGQVVPADLVITNFNIKREADYYRVKLSGTRQQATVTPTAPAISQSVELLKSALAGSPFHMRILETNVAGKIVSNDKAERKLTAGGVPVPEWLHRVVAAVPIKTEAPKSQALSDHFVIEGVVR